MIVLKFGGTSLGAAERIVRAARIVRDCREAGPVVVVSALAGVTDLLEQALGAARGGERERLEPLLADLERRHRWALAGSVEEPGRRHRVGLELDRRFEDLRGRLRSIRILREQTPRARDAVLSLGEDLSARIVTAALLDAGLAAHRVDPTRVVATDGRHGRAEPDLDEIRRRVREHLLPLVLSGEIPVLGGHVGSGPDGVTTTLGRGGSDTSAAVLGLALGVQEIQIWTDVDGILSADPRRVPGARTLDRVSFAEAAELAHYGARVLHPDCVAPAVRAAIPVRIRNALQPSRAGTLVLDGEADSADRRPVALASRDDVTCLRFTGSRMRRDPDLLPQILRACRTASLDPVYVQASDLAVLLVVPDPDDPATLGRIAPQGVEADVHPARAIVCVVGAGLSDPGPLRRAVLAAVAECDPEMVGLGASRAGLACVVSRDRLEPVLRQLHARFLEEVPR